MEILIFTLFILIYFIADTIYLDYFQYKKQQQDDIKKIEDFLTLRTPQIHVFSKELSNHYHCHLCRSQKLDTNVISISGREYTHISHKRPHKFLKATCMTCGFSEYYNLNIMWGPDGLDPLSLDSPYFERFHLHCNNFHCHKCSNPSAVAKTITIKKKGFRHWLNVQPSELTCICCSQCGWTTFYDTELLLKQEKTSHA